MLHSLQLYSSKPIARLLLAFSFEQWDHPGRCFRSGEMFLSLFFFFCSCCNLSETMDKVRAMLGIPDWESLTLGVLGSVYKRVNIESVPRSVSILWPSSWQDCFTSQCCLKSIYISILHLTRRLFFSVCFLFVCLLPGLSKIYQIVYLEMW